MRPFLAFLALVPWLIAAADDSTPAKKPLPAAVTAPQDYVKDIQPIFTAHCVSCHGPAKQRAGLRLDSAEQVRAGGNSGPVLTAGKSEESLLIHLVAGWEADRQMPPKGPPLTPEEIGTIRAWIDQGAKGSGGGAGTLGQVKSDHWAFQPICVPALPTVKQPRWIRNAIDQFVLARLEKEGLAPSTEADARTLIRRLYFDLLGLPPRPEEVEEFLNDRGPGAYERLVERVLASPHYGERWGRHWLDAARYADSDGYEKDTGRPWAWRYRHWVIDAFNRDMPFDQFTIEQLAGDLLPNATPEQIAATGFHRNTLKNLEGGVDQEEYRVAAVVDRVNTTATVFLGLTMGCCQCHDHKYDPLTQREFYQFFAFFNSDEEQLAEAPLPGEEAAVAFLKTYHEPHRTLLEMQAKGYEKDGLPLAQEKWEADLKVPELRKLSDAVKTILLIEPAKRTPRQRAELQAYYQKVDPKLQALRRQLQQHEAKAPKVSQAQVLARGKGRPTHVHIRGDFQRKGVQVNTGVPGVLPPLAAKTEVAFAGPRFPLPPTPPPTRLDLARWLVAEQNPLPTRVIVNWVWLHHFGRGLVATPEDFGTRGEKPSHPELLDWLAAEFRRQGFSIKQLHRLIVTSATYRQSSFTRPELLEMDPANVLLARMPRLRLEAEIVRDAALASSGLLDRRIGGSSVRPPQPAGIAELTYANSAKWVESTGPDRYRRGLYIWFQRTSPYPMLLAFDSPDSNVCLVRRERSNTPLQALTLLNDTVFVEAAQALSRRLLKEADKDEERLRRGFELTVSRPPTDREQATLLRLLNTLRQEVAAMPPEQATKLIGSYNVAGTPPAEQVAWVGLARTLLNLDEFVTRE